MGWAAHIVPLSAIIVYGCTAYTSAWQMHGGFKARTRWSICSQGVLLAKRGNALYDDLKFPNPKSLKRMRVEPRLRWGGNWEGNPCHCEPGPTRVSNRLKCVSIYWGFVAVKRHLRTSAASRNDLNLCCHHCQKKTNVFLVVWLNVTGWCHFVCFYLCQAAWCWLADCKHW